jgi:hypothetical protein
MFDHDYDSWWIEFLDMGLCRLNVKWWKEKNCVNIGVLMI